MSWICVGCSVHHEDRMDVMGFGLCRECAETAKRKKAEERAAMIAKRMKNRKK